jgi:glycosyl transferase, family 25
MSSLEIVVISLPTSTQRRGLVAERLNSLPWPWRFFDAHTSADNRLPYDPERAFLRRGYRLKSGEIGAFSSHYECMRQHAAAVDPARPYLVVLEDDVLLDGSFDLDIIPKLMTALRIEYLRLYSRFITRVRYLGRVGVSRGLYRFIVPPYGSQAYVVSRTGAQRFVQSVTCIERPIDDEMDRYWVNGLPAFALFPYPALELSLQSTVIKGYADHKPRSRTQRAQSVALILWEKILREYCSFGLRSKDRALSHALSRLDLQSADRPRTL